MIARRLGRCRHCWRKLAVVQVVGLQRPDAARMCSHCDSPTLHIYASENLDV